MNALRSLVLVTLATLPVSKAFAQTPSQSPGEGTEARPAPTAPSSATIKPAPRAPANGHDAPPAEDAEAAGGGAPPGHPGMASAEAQADVNESNPSLPPGSITATIVNESGIPVAGQQVRLGILFQKIAEGESRSEKFTQADAQGTARFTDLQMGSDHAYRVTVQVGPATYQTSPFNLRRDMGQRVVLHTYPSTSDVDQVAIGMRGYLYIETRDDVFQCEALFRVFNVGQVTWVPKDVIVQLPKGFKAFKAQEGMTDVRFENVDGVGARLKGTFSPGQNEASFRFQMPKSTEAEASFRMGLPPHVAEMRVIAEASSAMNLEVDGFQPPVATANQTGQRVLVSVKQLQRRDEEIKDFTATLSGIPTPGPGRWYAILIAVGMALGGVLSARGVFDDPGSGKNVTADKRRARELLMGELVALEAARREERIGPRSYAQSRSALIDAIARLGLPPQRLRAGHKLGSASSARKRPKAPAERS